MNGTGVALMVRGRKCNGLGKKIVFWLSNAAGISS
jgi:hypothetical protein